MDFSNLLVLDEKETDKKTMPSQKGKVDYSALLNIEPKEAPKRIDYSGLLSKPAKTATKLVQEGVKPFIGQVPFAKAKETSEWLPFVGEKYEKAMSYPRKKLLGVESFQPIMEKAPDWAVNLIPPLTPFKKEETKFRKQVIGQIADIYTRPDILLMEFVPRAISIVTTRPVTDIEHQIMQKMVEPFRQKLQQGGISPMQFSPEGTTLKVSPDITWIFGKNASMVMRGEKIRVPRNFRMNMPLVKKTVEETGKAIEKVSQAITPKAITPITKPIVSAKPVVSAMPTVIPEPTIPVIAPKLPIIAPEPPKPTGEGKVETIVDVENLIAQKSKEYGGRNEFLASEEYKKLYPQVEKIYKETKSEFVSKATKAMEESGVKEGNKVSTLAQGLAGGEEVSGTIIMKGGIPYVKLDSPQMTSDGYRKQVQWHKGWKLSTPTGGKVVAEEVKPITKETRAEKLSNEAIIKATLKIPDTIEAKSIMMFDKKYSALKSTEKKKVLSNVGEQAFVTDEKEAIDLADNYRGYNIKENEGRNNALLNPKADFVTDGKYLITDKTVAKKIQADYWEKMKQDYIKGSQKGGVSYKEAVENANNLILERQKDVQSPDIKSIIESAKENTIKPLEFIGIRTSDTMNPLSVYSDGKEHYLLDSRYIKFFKNYFPNAIFKGEAPDKPIGVYVGKELKGVVLPMQNDGVDLPLTKANLKSSEAGQISTKYFTYIPEKVQQNLDEIQYAVKNPISKSIISDIQYVNLKAVRNAADGLVRVDYLRGLTPEEDLMLTDLLEGKQIKPKDKTQFNKLYVLSVKLRKSLNKIWDKASNAGVKEKIVTDEGVEWIPIRHIDKYVPREIHPDIREKLNGGLKQLYQRIMELKQQGVKSNIKQAILEAKTQGDPYIVRLIDWLEQQDIHTTPSKIVRLIDKLVNRDYISSYGHLERPRLIENALPPEFYERRASVLFNRYFAGAGRRIAEVEKFGSTNEKLLNRMKLLGKMNKDEEKIIRKLISRYQDITDHPISSKIATAISIAKIGLGTSTIPNITQVLISTIPKQGVWTFLRGAFNLAMSKETKRLVAKTGLPYSDIIRQIMGYKDKGVLDTVNDKLVTWNLFKGVNRLNALLTSSSTEYWVKNVLLPRTKSPIPFLRKQAFNNLAKLRITPDDIIQGKISDEKLIDAMLLTSMNYQLFSDITKEPLWLSNPHLRWATVLKRFGAKQPLLIIHDIVYDELKNANPLPLLRLIAGGILAGAFTIWANRKIYDTISYVKETITGETREPPDWYSKWDDEDRKLWVQALDLFAQAGALGVLSDIARLDSKSNWNLSRNMEFLLEPVILAEAIRSGRIIDILVKSQKMRGRHKIEIPIEEKLQKVGKEVLRGFPLTKFFIEKE